MNKLFEQLFELRISDKCLILNKIRYICHMLYLNIQFLSFWLPFQPHWQTKYSYFDHIGQNRFRHYSQTWSFACISWLDRPNPECVKGNFVLIVNLLGVGHVISVWLVLPDKGKINKPFYKNQLKILIQNDWNIKTWLLLIKI